MKKVLAVVVVLVLVTPTMAGPLLKITAPQFEGNLMFFDLVTVDTDGWPDTVAGFGARAIINGADAGRFIGKRNEVNGVSGAQMVVMTSPAAYAWENFFLPVVAESGPNWVTFGANAWFPGDHVRLDDLAPGTVIGRFYFTDSNPGAPVSEIVVNIWSYAQIEAAPVFTTSAAESIFGTVLNDGTNIVPEPATVGLVALGLVTLAARRGKRRG